MGKGWRGVVVCDTNQFYPCTKQIGTFKIMVTLGTNKLAFNSKMYLKYVRCTDLKKL